MKKLIVLSVLGVILYAASSAQASVLQLPHKPFNQMTRTEKIHYLKNQLYHDHGIIRFWHNHRELASAHSWQAGKQVHWARVSLRVAGRNLHSLLQSAVARLRVSGDMGAWQCIHGYEGSWQDSGSPYWGGLQMDMTFQQEYGPEFLRRYGTADHWPIIDQITAARRARDGWHNPYSGRTFKGRGYSPWPNTAHLCGLY